MEEVELTKNRLLKIWWSLFWRGWIAIAIGFIVAFLFGLVVSFLFSLVLMPIGFGLNAIYILSNGVVIPLSFVVGVYFTCLAMKSAINKKSFGDFRIALVPVNNELAK